MEKDEGVSVFEKGICLSVVCGLCFLALVMEFEVILFLKTFSEDVARVYHALGHIEELEVQLLAVLEEW